MLRWLFLDMNSYFASVEQQFRPMLRGRPVGVIPVETEHTCCIAASSQAKRFGVRTGTTVLEARQRCPDITLVLARPRFYVQVHQRICAAAERHLPIEQVESIDEMAFRLLGTERQRDRAVERAKAIKRQIAEDVGEVLTCSVGVAPTRLLAKIASDLHKPDGLTVLDQADLPGPLTSRDIEDLCGIGPGMTARLRRHGVDSVQKLWDLSRREARHLWGSVTGEHWWDGFHGVDNPRVRTRTGSMGHGHVLPTAYRTFPGAEAIMVRLLHKAAARLREHGYLAHRLSVSIRFVSGQGWGEHIALPSVQDTLTILQHFRRLWDRPSRRAVGHTETPQKVQVTLLELTPVGQTPGHLFPQADRPRRLCEAMDRFNIRHAADLGGHGVCFGSMLPCRDYVMDDKIAFGRVPDDQVAM